MRALVVLLLLVVPAYAGDVDPVVLYDFETGEPADGWSFSGVGLAEVTVEEDQTPSGGRALMLTGVDDRNDRVGYIYRKIEENDWRSYAAFRFHAKVEGKQPIEMRVIGWDGRGRRGILCRFTLEPGDWREVLLPLSTWREEFWDYVGDFERISGLEIRWDDGTGKVTLDDICLIPGEREDLSCRVSSKERLEFAFPDGKAKLLESDELRVYTNATRFKGKEGKKLVQGLGKVGELLEKRYGVTGETERKVEFVIFRDEAEYKAFYPRLGKQYGANVRAPASTGYSALGVVGSTWSAEYGWKRPVYVHEMSHGLVRLRLGLMSNGNWVQEALANAVQLQLYPESAAKVNFLSHFAARRDGLGPFLPLAELCAMKRPGSDHYAQLATIADYFAERKKDQLEEIWKIVRDHDKRVSEGLIEKIAASMTMTMGDLQADWAVWGVEKYKKLRKK